MKIHNNIKVEGRVQGVFFRVSTQREALKLGLTGFVRNEPDGSVYLEVEGAQEKIDQLTTWIKLGGPPRAEVFNIDCQVAGAKDFKGFQIK